MSYWILGLCVPYSAQYAVVAQGMCVKRLPQLHIAERMNETT